jgi:dienelactone hydrolase
MNTRTDIPSDRNFNYSIDGSDPYWAQHHVGGNKARIVLLPDWEGAHSDWAQLMAFNYATTCEAEVILTDPYGASTPKPSFEAAAKFNQRLLGQPDEVRALLRGMTKALSGEWREAGPLIVVGFCSGGAYSLEAGRAGIGADAVFCVHGNPQSPKPLLHAGQYPLFSVIHGGDDPVITSDQLIAFETEMRGVKAPWSLHVISGAKHSFTRFDIQREYYAVGYSQRAEVEARHLLRSQIASIHEIRASNLRRPPSENE